MSGGKKIVQNIKIPLPPNDIKNNDRNGSKTSI